MRDRTLNIMLLTAFLGLLVNPWATDPWATAAEVTALEPLIEEALQNNPEIRAATARWEAASRRPSQAGSLPNPTIGGRFKNVGFDNISQGDNPRTDIQAFLSQQIPFPGKLSLKERVAREESEAEKWFLDAATRRVVAELKVAYFEWFLVDKSIEITEKNKAILEDFAKIARAKYEVGEGVQQDVIKAQVEVSRFIEMLEILRRKKEIVEAEIRSILNRPPESSLGRADEIRHSALDLSFQQIEGLLHSNAPNLKARARLVESRQEALRLARREYFPDFEIAGTYFNRDGGDGQLEDIWQVGIGLKVPLYFWRKERFGIQEAAAQAKESEQRYEATRQNLTFQAADNFEKIRTAGRLIGLYKEGIIPQSELSLESAIAGYRVGDVDFLTLLDNIRVLFNFELEYYRQLAEHEKAVARLEEITGVDITKTSEEDK